MSETDTKFLDRMAVSITVGTQPTEADLTRLLSLARRGAEAARLEARVVELEAALQAMKEMAEYWINLQLGNMKAEGVISKERYDTWLALGHQSKAMNLTRAALTQTTKGGE
jgi:hypothetical protein